MSVGNFTILLEFSAEEKVANAFFDFIDELARSHSQLAVTGTGIGELSDGWPPPDPKQRHSRHFVVGSARSFVYFLPAPLNSRRSPTPLSRTGDLLTERNPT